jgi:uncharacterized protein
MSKIHLAKGLSVPAEEIATQVVAALGMRGSGKSNIMAVIVEGLIAARVQVLVLDYVGIWFSVGLDPSGKRPSPFRIPVLGGRHGDIGLVPGAGKDVAKALAGSGSSAVLDVSDFSKAGRCAFATDLAEALFAAKKQHPSPTFLVLEEAQRFIPQKLYSGQGQERMLGAFEEIAEVGRNYGLGLGMISQRPQKLNKDVLNLTELLLAFQTNGVLERKAIAEWVQEKDAEGRREVNNELPSLVRGETLAWSPSWLRIYGRYHTFKKNTYDAGATPIKARAAVKMKPLDLKSLEAAMAEVVKAAQKDDPKALRAEVARLQRELERAGKPPAHAKAQIVAQVPAAARRTLATAGRQITRLILDLERMAKSAHEIATAVESVEKDAASLPVVAAPPVASVTTNGTSTYSYRANRGLRKRAEADLPGENGDKSLSRAARAMLAALAQLGGQGNDAQISILSGYSITSSSFTNAKGELRSAGLIEYTGPETRALTQTGRELTSDVPPLPHGEELLRQWLSKIEARAERVFLQVLWDHGPLSRETLSEKSGYSITSSSFSNAIGALRSARLIDAPKDAETIALAATFRE